MLVYVKFIFVWQKLDSLFLFFQYAMKVIDLRTSPQDEKDLAVKEAQLLKQLDHPHILSYTDSFENDGALCIVTGYCANGDLSVFLEKRNRKKLEEDRLIEWFRQIASALEVRPEWFKIRWLEMCLQKKKKKTKKNKKTMPPTLCMSIQNTKVGKGHN